MKSHVGLETKACIVCGKEYETGSILLDRMVRATLEERNCTGWGMCAEHEALKKEGYVALIAVHNGAPGMKPEKADRTGDVLHIRAEAWPKIFNVPVPPAMVAFAEPLAVERVKALVERRTGQ